MLKRGEAEALLVLKLDRLTRSLVDLGSLVDRYFAAGKSALLSVGEQIDTLSAAGRLVLNVLASVSQWEREAIGERTAVAMQHKVSQGEYTGGQAPYGRPSGARTQAARARERRSALKCIGGAMDYVEHTVGVQLPELLWRAASATFAANASGSATGVILSQAPDSFWLRPPESGR